MTPSMIGALVGHFVLMVPAAMTTPFGKWRLGLLLFNGWLIRLIAAILCGVTAKCIWE